MWNVPGMDILILMSSLFVEAVGHLPNNLYLCLTVTCTHLHIIIGRACASCGRLSRQQSALRLLYFAGVDGRAVRDVSVLCLLGTHRVAAVIIECIHRSSRSVSAVAAADDAAVIHC